MQVRHSLSSNIYFFISAAGELSKKYSFADAAILGCGFCISCIAAEASYFLIHKCTGVVVNLK